MHALSAGDIRASFVNTSVRERSGLVLPDLDAVPWDRIDFLGWRDPRAPLAGHVVVPVDGEPVGVLLRQSEQRSRARPQCAWCEDVTLPNDVVFFAARRAGAAGRQGNTVGTLVCARFECSANARKAPPVAYLGFDVEAARAARIAGLRERVAAFARRVRDGDDGEGA